MFPEQTQFPEFVPDQILTSDHLNKLFGYLDEQGRMTRTNLIGIGIVCGLEVKINTAGTAITISKGCGITSQGYLVSVDEHTYTRYKPYNAVKEHIYDLFVNGATMQQRFPLDELMASAVEEGSVPLTAAYLQDKIVMLFVELLSEGAKNCDPNSCDDKGIGVTVTIRPLLVSKANAATLMGSITPGTNNGNSWDTLPVLKIPRFDVAATNMLDTASLFKAYMKILNATFLTKTETALTQAFNTFAPLIADTVPSNPFAGLANDSRFLHDGTIGIVDLVNIQYYYDFFSDVFDAYDELRRTGMEIMGMCCPGSDLFPRHLLLGPADNVTSMTTPYRHYFIPSPAVQACCKQISALRWLFRRLVLMFEKFVIPQSGVNANSYIKNRRETSAAAIPIRITPGTLGPAPLSHKAIPFYYNVADGTDKLFAYWDPYKTRHGMADQNLSYRADEYNSTDDDILRPLKYNLEPYNFLRIEGHIGKSFTTALSTINSIKDSNRLPIDVLALSADVNTLRTQWAGILNNTNAASLRELLQGGQIGMCHFQDLEAIYDTISAELICTLCKEMRYFYGLPSVGDVSLPTPDSLVPQVPLLKKCDPGFRFAANTLGHQFEIFYNDVKSQAYIPLNSFFAGYAYGTTVLTERFNLNEARIFLALLYYMEKLSEVITTSVGSFNLAVFNTRFNDLNRIAAIVKVLVNRGDDAGNISTEDMSDHLDVIIYGCRQAQFTALYNDYKLRWLYLAMLQKFGYYIKLNPGIQHKAGVPMGGTFIMVYHEATRTPATNRITAFNTVAANIAKDTARDTAAAPRMMKESSGPEMKTAAEDTGAEATTGFNTISESYSVDPKQQQVSATSKIKNVFTERQQTLLNSLLNAKSETIDEVLAETIRRIPNGTVIADFYLPYLCCSDCPPVYYVVATEPQNDLTVSLKQKEYCSDDKGPYEIAVSPTGGTVTGEGVTANANGGFRFTPSAVSVPAGSKSKVVTITYAKDGQTATTSVTVYARPKAMFAVEAASVFTTLHFIGQSENADKVSWDFGDNTPAVTEDSPFHNFNKPGTYVVTLTAANGVCTDTHTATIQIAQDTIQINPKEFCTEDQKIYPVSGTPTGGTVTGEGIIITNNGFGFSPSHVDLQDMDKRTVTLTYSTSDGQSVSTDVVVYNAVSLDISAVPEDGKPMVYRFSAFVGAAQTFEWDFGDGTTSKEKEVTHEYKKPGVYTVSLSGSNGACDNKVSQEIEVSAEPEKVCQPLEEIIADFNNLEKINKDIFASFIKLYDPYSQVAGFFKKLSGMAGATIDEQVSFFEAQKFTSLMMNWLSALNPLITGGNVRIIALALYKVFERLTMYVACIQKDDMGKAAVQTDGIFKMMQEQISGWSTLVGSLPAAEKATVKQMGDLFAAEATQVTANGEANTKPEYLAILKKLADLVTSFKL